MDSPQTREATATFEAHDHAGAKDEAEASFWNVLTDNSVEVAKPRLHELDGEDPRHKAARRLVSPEGREIGVPDMPGVNPSIAERTRCVPAAVARRELCAPGWAGLP